MEPVSATILIIDDDRAVCESFANHLEDFNFRVRQASDGEQGLEEFDKVFPDLVLLDLRMPKLGGLQVLERITEKSPETPVIVVSGTGVIGETVEALRLGAWDYLLKPIHDMTVLNHAVTKALERARLIKENRRYREHLEDKVRTRTSELSKTNEELAKVNERYRFLEENVTDNIWVFDLASQRLTYSTPSIDRILGYSPEEARSLSLDEMFLPESAAIIGATIDEELSRDPGGNSRGFGPVRELELEQRHKEGHTVWVEIRARFVRDQRGAPLSILGVTRDISERRELEAQIQRSQRMETVGRLAGGVAHDFNNLLTPILTYADLLLSEMPQQDPRYDDLSQIKEAADRAKQLTRQLLFLGRKQLLERKVVDLAEIIGDFQGILRRTIREDIKLRLRVTATKNRVVGDRSQIEQVLMNLAVNAQDAMPEGGEMTIEVSNRANPPLPSSAESRNRLWVTLSVHDTGCGMDAATREKIFEPFFTTKSPGKGTGLGLATTYRIVQKHGGTITVASTEGQGAVFHVWFPVADDSLLPDAAPARAAKVESGNETILVVEDDDLVRKLAIAILSRQGYDVLVGETPEGALDLARSHEGRIDLLLSDVVMPQMNGRQLHSRLSDIRPGVKVLYMSGYAEDVVAHQGLVDGHSFAFVQKPFTAQLLAQKVREALS